MNRQNIETAQRLDSELREIDYTLEVFNGYFGTKYKEFLIEFFTKMPNVGSNLKEPLAKHLINKSIEWLKELTKTKENQIEKLDEIMATTKERISERLEFYYEGCTIEDMVRDLSNFFSAKTLEEFSEFISDERGSEIDIFAED